MPMSASISYREPDIKTVLILSSFLLLLNAIDFLLDKALYCGLIGQILVGVAWGTPGSKWLDDATEDVITKLGYLGLLMIVYEGGLSTSFASLKTNFKLAIVVAATGVAAPIALSFTLCQIIGASSLQAFAAGAALCSTSLGTTFTVLSTSGLTKTRLGIVLTIAAMIDDVIGLVMVQIIGSLGSTASLSAVTVVRPILVSLGFAIVFPLICWCIVRPLTNWLNEWRKSRPDGLINRILISQATSLIGYIGVLLGLCAAGSYAGTSNLFGVYIAGAGTNWFSDFINHAEQSADCHLKEPKNEAGVGGASSSKAPKNRISGANFYDKYFRQSVNRILKPFFFASVGFSIPISQMFSGPIIWRGIVYTVLMTAGKLLCGIWLIRFTFPSTLLHAVLMVRKRILDLFSVKKTSPISPKGENQGSNPQVISRESKSQSPSSNPPATTKEGVQQVRPELIAENNQTHTQPSYMKPTSLYPAGILGSAMVARGEIGFLISAVAEGNHIFSSESKMNSDIFLVVTWSIMLCTVIGPICVGLLVRRVKRLQAERGVQTYPEGSRDISGDWGVQ